MSLSNKIELSVDLSTKYLVSTFYYCEKAADKNIDMSAKRAALLKGSSLLKSAIFLSPIPQHQFQLRTLYLL
jgi:hypothetical protein